MNLIHKMQNILRGKAKVLITLSVPVLLLIVSLCALLSERFSVYVRNCYFEIISVACIWVFLCAFIILLRRMKQSSVINMVIPLILIAITLACAYPYAMKVARGRYVFYKSGLYAVPSEDIRYIESAISAYEEKDWSLVKSSLDKCSDAGRVFFSYSTGRLYAAVENVELSLSNFKTIVDSYEVTPAIIGLYNSLVDDFGEEVLSEYAYLKENVQNEVDSIELLYDAVEESDAEECLRLISQHGRYWFEPEMLEYICNAPDCVKTLKDVVIKDDNGLTFKENLKYVWGL